MAVNQQKRTNSGGIAVAPIGWQAKKSASTRELFIVAAIKCLVDLGYARTTTIVIAEKAGLSRGAMLHHFPSKLSIVRAAVAYLLAKRLRAFRRALAKEPTDGDHVRLSVEGYWAHVKHPWFVAFFEMAVAARTDKELAEILFPAQKAFEKSVTRPVWGDFRSGSAKARDSCSVST